MLSMQWLLVLALVLLSSLSVYIIIDHESRAPSFSAYSKWKIQKGGSLKGGLPTSSTKSSSTNGDEDDVSDVKAKDDFAEDKDALAGEDYSGEKKGKLTCSGSLVDSEVIYWKEVPGDLEYERCAITPNPPIFPTFPNVPNSPNSIYVVRSLRTTVSTMIASLRSPMTKGGGTTYVWESNASLSWHMLWVYTSYPSLLTS